MCVDKEGTGSLGIVRCPKKAHIRGPINSRLPFALVAVRRVDKGGNLAHEIVALELVQLVGRQPHVHAASGLERAQAAHDRAVAVVAIAAAVRSETSQLIGVVAKGKR